MTVTYGPKHVASHTIKYDVFDVICFIILILIRSANLLIEMFRPLNKISVQSREY